LFLPGTLQKEGGMSDWFHDLPLVWMAVLVFGITYVIAAAILAGVTILGSGDRARSLRAVSSGVLSPLGILFGLFVTFTAVQVWDDNGRATASIDREASALRAVLILSATIRRTRKLAWVR